jgi:DNA processing protein
VTARRLPPEELHRWVALSAVPGVGARTFQRLLAVFGSAEDTLAASVTDLVSLGRLAPAIARQVVSAGHRVGRVRRELIALRAEGVEVFARGDEGYPTNLTVLDDAPPVLYVRGEMQEGDDLACAIVGTRTPTPEAAELATALADGLAREGIVIASGLALGIDTAGHRGALQAGGRTLAALGSGVLRVYPPGNEDLADEISAHGAVVSERPPRARVTREGLLARNRIIAGLARAVLVVQTERPGGALVAARRAHRQGALVYSVWWEDEPYRAGCEKLREYGAQFLTGLDDVPAVAAALREVELPPPAPALF